MTSQTSETQAHTKMEIEENDPAKSISEKESSTSTTHTNSTNSKLSIITGGSRACK